ncbi:cysteine synthase (O-acetylserine (thiol)-lyase) [Suillus variegatus]|nr:cysteine synthase (O-acetylserine (thiol)-lyase) [Suillus variegatus]
MLRRMFTRQANFATIPLQHCVLLSSEIRNLHAPQNRSNNVDFKSAPLARDHNQALVVREHELQDKVSACGHWLNSQITCSVKDGCRQIKLGGTVVKGTAGNTSIGLPMFFGYCFFLLMLCSQSQAKIDLLRMLNAETLSYNHQAEEMSWTEQFDNTANAHVFYISTGSEIWEQRKGEIDCFVCAHLKERSNGRTQIWLTDPPGSVLYEHVKSGGNLVKCSESSITEGQTYPGRVTSNFGTFVISMLCQFLNTEGLYVGVSSVLNVVAAVELVQKLGKGKDRS